MHIRVDGLQKPDRNIKRRSEGVREVEKKKRAHLYMFEFSERNSPKNEYRQSKWYSRGW